MRTLQNHDGYLKYVSIPYYYITANVAMQLKQEQALPYMI